MKQIDFKDPYSRKITYEIDFDQLQYITDLYLNKDTSMNIEIQVHFEYKDSIQVQYEYQDTSAV